MRRHVLMSNEEPTDSELEQLMHEVALEAKRKYLLAHKQLAEKINQLILESKSKK